MCMVASERCVCWAGAVFRDVVAEVCVCGLCWWCGDDIDAGGKSIECGWLVELLSLRRSFGHRSVRPSARAAAARAHTRELVKPLFQMKVSAL